MHRDDNCPSLGWFLSPEHAPTSFSNCQCTQIKSSLVKNTLKTSKPFCFPCLCSISTPHYFLLLTRTLRQATSIQLEKGSIFWILFPTNCFLTEFVKALKVIRRARVWSMYFWEQLDYLLSLKTQIGLIYWGYFIPAESSQSNKGLKTLAEQGTSGPILPTAMPYRQT